MTTTHPTVLASPTTSNTITSRERKRLLISTRKIGAMLGASPVLTEAPLQPFSAALYPVSSASSASSSRSSTPDSTKASRRQASICAFSPGKPQFVFTSAEGASSVVSLTIPEHEETETGVKVKTLAKKASMKFKSSVSSSTKSRGSNELPRPLVLRLNAVPQPIVVRPPNSPALSTTSGMLTPTPGTPTPTTSPAATPTTPVFPSPTELRRKRIAKLTRTLGEIIPPYLVSASKRPAATAQADVIPQSPSAPFAEAADIRPMTRQRRSMSVDYSNQAPPMFSRSSRVWVTGSETWRGEWNRKDIKDVQKQLRSLKAR